MGNSNENLCSCKDDRQRTSFYATPQKHKAHFGEDEKDNHTPTTPNHDLGDNCGFFKMKSNSEKNILKSNSDRLPKRQMTFGRDNNNNVNENERPERKKKGASNDKVKFK